jgi:hypothetical protein
VGLLLIHDSAQVALSGVRALGTLTTFGFPLPGYSTTSYAHAGILVERSAVWMMDCEAGGNASRVITSGFGADGGHGLRAIDSFVHLGRSQIRGGQSGGHAAGTIGFGGHGIDAAGSTVILHGDAGNLTTGAPGFELPLGTPALGAAGSAITLDGTSTVGYASDVVLVPGTGTATLPAGATIDAAPGSTVGASVHRLPTVSMLPSTVPLGTTLSVRIAGEPNLDHIRAVTLQTAPATLLAGVLGALVIDVPTVVIFHLESLGPSGVLTTPVPVPADPSLAGLVIVEQGAQVLPTGIVLSPPALAALR